MGVTNRLRLGWQVFRLVVRGRYCEAMQALLGRVTERGPVGAEWPARQGQYTHETEGSARRWFPRR